MVRETLNQWFVLRQYVSQIAHTSCLICVPLWYVSVQHRSKRDAALTRWTKVLPLPGRPELLLHGLLEAGLREARCAPNFQLHMLLVVDPVRVEH